MKTIIFACVHSAGRSQMAAAWFNALVEPGEGRAVAAGTQPAERVHPVVVEAMKEVGIDLSAAKPQPLTDALVATAAALITMGCGESCPVAPSRVLRDDWDLPDPKGQPIERVREIREDVRRRVVSLLTGQGWGRRQ